MQYSWQSFWRFYVAAILIAALVMMISFLGGLTSVLADLYTYMLETPAYPNVLSIGTFAIKENSAGWLVLLFAAAPTLAALLVCGWHSKFALTNLLARLKPVGPDPTHARVSRVYLSLFAVYGVVLLTDLAITYTTGSAEVVERTWAVLGDSLPLILAWCLIAPFMDEGGLLEELGWRGFAWPALQSLLASPLKAALVLGTLWWAWHLPRELPTLLAADNLMMWVWYQSLFLCLCLAESIVCGYVVNLCGGSVLPAIMVHGGSNVWNKAAASEIFRLTDGVDVRTVILVIAALIIVWRGGRELGRQPKET